MTEMKEQLKISSKAKKALFSQKRYGETYSDVILRLSKDEDALKERMFEDILKIQNLMFEDISAEFSHELADMINGWFK